jgi:GNAT superfamily N-acetyltransferase
MVAGSTKRTPVGTLVAGPGSGLIRSASLEDADRIREFVCGLSPRSQYFRFFASVAPPSTGLLRALCGASGTADILIVTDSRDAVIGHAMAADGRVAGRIETNIGLVIADDRQQQGLGTRLLSLLVARAAARGVSALVLDVLPANDIMRGIITRRWPGTPTERTRDAIVFRPAIEPAIDPADTAGVAIEAELPLIVSLVRPSLTGTRLSGADIRGSDLTAAVRGGPRAPDRSAA